jgi:predicted nicotinamide N-methyase
VLLPPPSPHLLPRGHLVLQALAQQTIQQLTPQDPATYTSAFPNVGLVVWQAGLVLADYLLRTAPCGPWLNQRILELGCGVGQLGIPLAMAGAQVTLTDLPHIVPLTQHNVELNSYGMAQPARVMPFLWGTDPAPLGYGAHPPDMVVAADVLYEPQYYPLLLATLQDLCPPPAVGAAAAAAGVPAAVAPSPPPAAAVSPSEGEAAAAGDRTPPSPSPSDVVNNHAAATGGTNGSSSCSGQLAPSSTAAAAAAQVTSCLEDLHVSSSTTQDHQQQHQEQQQKQAGEASGAASNHVQPSSADTQPPPAAPAAPDKQQQRPVCYVCYRVRKYAEHLLQQQAAAAGFSVEVVPVEELHPEYRCGGWQMLRLVRTSPGLPARGAQ